MRKRDLFALVMAALLLSACSGADPSPPTPVQMEATPSFADVSPFDPAVTTAPPPTSMPALSTPTEPPLSVIPENPQPITGENLDLLQPIYELPFISIHNPAFSPDNRYMSMGLGGRSGVERWGTLVFDLTTQQEVLWLEDEYPHMQFAPDSGSIYLMEGATLTEFDLVSGQETILYESVQTCAALSPDARRLAVLQVTGLDDKESTITVIDLQTGQETPLDPVDLGLHADQFQFSPDGRVLVAIYGFLSDSGSGVTFIIWDAFSGELRGVVPSYEALALDPRGGYLAATIYDRGYLSIISLDSLELMRFFGPGSGHFYRRPQYTSDGSMLFVNDGGVLRFFDPDSGEELGAVELPYTIGWSAMSADRTLLAAGDSNYPGGVTLWAVQP
ncbi:MAG: hypothetical protein JXA97_03310 [Anaerolineales bacterium]|nr:hypothetical protein [Anaerolineales bacterium]